MAKVVLGATDTESDVLNDSGDQRLRVQLVCVLYGTAEVKLEVRDPELPLATYPWVTARYNDTEIRFAAAGDALDIVMTRGFAYRLTTATAGAVISMDEHPALLTRS